MQKSKCNYQYVGHLFLKWHNHLVRTELCKIDYFPCLHLTHQSIYIWATALKCSHHWSQITLLAFNFIQFQIMAGSSVFTSCIFLSLVMALAISGFNFKGSEAARAFFVFGDSLVDNGNNNYLATTARADAPPYGIDYPTRRPTGRFSNGLNIPDFISSVLILISPSLIYFVLFN